MKNRFPKVLSVAALGIVTAGIFIPQAAAQSFTNLAPGLDCERLQCISNSNNTYLVRYDAICLYPGADDPMGTVSGTEIVNPHERRTMSPMCRDHHSRHHRDVPGHPIDAYYKEAEVANLPPLRLPTGSAH